MRQVGMRHIYSIIRYSYLRLLESINNSCYRTFLRSHRQKIKFCSKSWKSAQPDQSKLDRTCSGESLVVDRTGYLSCNADIGFKLFEGECC